ncbi:hypothetical protein EDE12_103170 [Methylosinus sp. sav-2]|uniref:hypothetical protein n=1 Tax=Methylosinus sp. sav-2 TaxID=2485168 RepID=UPI000A57F38D|nr:hypothetical protein [Methylosinus sp. sav-2]TDX65195.1 hypothetical protein EDE12_103170 [Methylosinus sp. sav-2]
MRISATILSAAMLAALAGVPASSYAGARGPVVIRGLGPNDFAPRATANFQPFHPAARPARHWREEEPSYARAAVAPRRYRVAAEEATSWRQPIRYRASETAPVPYAEPADYSHEDYARAAVAPPRYRVPTEDVTQGRQPIRHRASEAASIPYAEPAYYPHEGYAGAAIAPQRYRVATEEAAQWRRPIRYRSETAAAPYVGQAYYSHAGNPYDRAYRPGAYTAVDPIPQRSAPVYGYFLDEGPFPTR